MSYIRTIPPEEAEGMLRELYEGDQKNLGFVPNYASALSLRPDVLNAYRQLSKAIRSHMRLRTYELITVVAAAEMGCRY